MNAAIILAGPDTGTFWDSSLGSTLSGLLIAIGVLVVLISLFKGVPKFIAGKFGDGLKSVIGGVIVAALCFQPELLTNLVGIVGDLIQQGSDSYEQVTNTGTGTGSTR